MNISFTPSVCTDSVNEKGVPVPATFDGTLVIRLPSAEERMEYMSEANINVEDLKSLKPMPYMMKKSYDHIVKIDLKKKSDGKKISTVDELRFDPDCFGIVTELAGKMMGGFVLGKT